jgi:hypothetical protein
MSLEQIFQQQYKTDQTPRRLVEDGCARLTNAWTEVKNTSSGRKGWFAMRRMVNAVVTSTLFLAGMTSIAFGQESRTANNVQKIEGDAASPALTKHATVRPMRPPSHFEAMSRR